MAKFFYIKRRFNDIFQKGTFDVVVLKGKRLNDYLATHSNYEVNNKKEYRLPITATDGKSVFVKGLGYIKTKCIETIPVYDGTIDAWNEYVLKYGYYCLFYSLTGYELNSSDCCAYNMQKEFNSFVASSMGLIKYARYVDLFQKINSIQTATLKNYPSIFDFEYDKYYFTPCYFISGILTVTPYVDTIKDDDKMECLYRRIRTTELKDKGIKDYQQIASVIDNEINEGTFTVCSKDRMKLLFGDECVEAYTSILDEFKY